MLRLLAVVCLAGVHAAVIKSGLQIPTYTQPCYRNKPDFNVCVKHALQGIIPKLAKAGIAELELEGLDPLRVPEMVMTYDGNAIGGNVTLRDTVTRGISNLKVLDIRSVVNDSTRFQLEIDFFIPKMVTGGFYKMEGHIGDVPVTGEDTYNISMSGVSGTWRLTGSPVVEDGQVYMKINKFQVIPEVQVLKVHANNLFKGNPQLSAAAITFVNRFWRVLYEEMLPYAQNTFDTVVRQIINKIFLNIPYDQLFPLARD